MAAFIETPRPELEEERVPGVTSGRNSTAKSAIHEVVHSYLAEWIIQRKPEELLPLFSIKSYPCVAEFGGDARPDSKLALFRILARMQERNKLLGSVSRLADVVAPVAYRSNGHTSVSELVHSTRGT
jgi:hypothetical protein